MPVMCLISHRARRDSFLSPRLPANGTMRLWSGWRGRSGCTSVRTGHKHRTKKWKPVFLRPGDRPSRRQSRRQSRWASTKIGLAPDRARTYINRICPDRPGLDHRHEPWPVAVFFQRTQTESQIGKVDWPHLRGHLHAVRQQDCAGAGGKMAPHCQRCTRPRFRKPRGRLIVRPIVPYAAVPAVVSATNTSSRSASRVVTSTMPQPSAWTLAMISPALVTSLS